ncbi:hypothetical protein DPMN_121710 [Dreissena polymorpha]|uniref:Uncharacterized protein n=1 Tax=Dreissena polymorpha TaxID=45954 RepID=A0A9D4JPT4_DREPO|nr:hypothetical protein DPMN_121710 [Dreissena polymorpha]
MIWSIDSRIGRSSKVNGCIGCPIGPALSETGVLLVQTTENNSGYVGVAHGRFAP